jgi:hypothetical protein
MSVRCGIKRAAREAVACQVCGRATSCSREKIASFWFVEVRLVGRWALAQKRECKAHARSIGGLQADSRGP